MAAPTDLLLVGATGMLGQALLRQACERGWRVRGLARSGADLSADVRDPAQVAKAFAAARPSIVMNLAAMTDVNQCEADPAAAHAINAQAVSILAERCAAEGVYLVQTSTDHFYTGDADGKHSEEDPVRLVNEYARSKYAGEQLALGCPGALVLRTNVVGFRGWPMPTFVEWVIDGLRTGRPIHAFDDFYTSSMDAGHFASSALDLIGLRASGVMNLASREVSSKRQFIEALARAFDLPQASVSPASVRSLPGAARAESAGLDVQRAEQVLGYPLPTLSQVVAALRIESRRRPRAAPDGSATIDGPAPAAPRC